MGYSTAFKGILTFDCKISIEMINELEKFMGEDFRDHSEWIGGSGLTWIDLQIVYKDGLPYGVEWNGSEKTYDLPEKINAITANMRIVYPDFKLKGELICQGDDICDRWKLVMVNGSATHVKIDDPKIFEIEYDNSKGTLNRCNIWYTCPRCGHLDVAEQSNFCERCGVKLKWV